MSQTANRVIKNTGFLYVKMGITMFVSLYSTRLILNTLGASDFGIFNIVGGAIAMLGFLNSSMASATQRFMSFAEGRGDIEKKKIIFTISVVLHLLLSVIVGILLFGAGFLFFNGVLNIEQDRIFAAKIIYTSLIVSTMFSVMSVPYDAVVNSHENMKYYAFVGIIESVLKLAIAFVCVNTSGDKLIIYGILMACVPLFTLSIMRIYCHRNYEECVLSPRYWHRHEVKEMMNFAGLNLVNSAVIMVSAQGYSIILNSFFGTLLNAAQGIAGQINGQLQVMSSNMMKALNPIFGKSAGAQNQELLQKSAFLGSKWSTALYLLVAVPVFLNTPYVLKLWLKSYPEWTVVFVRFQLIRSFIEFLFGTIPSLIKASGRIKTYTFLSTLFNVFQLPVVYMLFKWGAQPYFMYIVAIVFANLAVYMSALWCAKRIVGFPVLLFLKEVVLKMTLVVLFTILIMECYMLLFEVGDIASFVIFLTVFIVVYGLLLFFVGNSKDERVYLISVVKNVHK